jgi:DNA helicase IV
MTLAPRPTDAELQAIAAQRGVKDWQNSMLPDVKPLRAATVEVAELYEGMNKTERKRAEELEAMKRSGEIVEWWYEAVTLKLAHDCRYTPDFLIQENDGRLRFEETKGFWRDDAKVKTRVAVRIFPFPLRVLKVRKGGGWNIEIVHA